MLVMIGTKVKCNYEITNTIIGYSTYLYISLMYSNTYVYVCLYASVQSTNLQKYYRI